MLRRRRSQGQEHGQGNNVREQYRKQGKDQEEEHNHTELLSLWFVHRNRRERNIFENIGENYIDFMNMYMTRNKNMEQSVSKKIGKQFMPFVALTAAALFKLEEKFYIVFNLVSEWSLGLGYAAEYSVEKFRIVLKEFILERVVGRILFGCAALGMITWIILSYIAHGNTLFRASSKTES